MAEIRDSQGYTLTSQPIRAGSFPQTFVIPAGTGTGVYTPSQVDLGGIYQGTIMVLTGGTGITTGTVQLQGSLDNANWYNCSGAIAEPGAATTTAAQNQPTAGQGTAGSNVTAGRYFRLNVTVAVATGPLTVSFGAY